LTGAAVRVGVGTRFQFDGEVVTVVEFAATTAGNEVALKDGRGRMTRISLRELLFSDRAAVIPEAPGPSSDDDELAFLALAQLDGPGRARMLERAEHVREVLTGYRSGHAEFALEGEPHPQFDPSLPLGTRYTAKAAELGVTHLTVRRWVAKFHENGEAGLAGKQPQGGLRHAQCRRAMGETAIEVMVEFTQRIEALAYRFVIESHHARVIARFGPDVVLQPSRATAFRVRSAGASVSDIPPEHQAQSATSRSAPTGRTASCARPGPGEYLLMDTTRLDVFAFDPFTLRWVQAELSVAMDWYSRCIIGIRVTPVSTKAADVSAVLYQAFRPRPARGRTGQGTPYGRITAFRALVLVDVCAVESPGFCDSTRCAGDLVIDHGKVYVSAHLTSVCRRMGISSATPTTYRA
jgi:transposase InsO family protein